MARLWVKFSRTLGASFTNQFGPIGGEAFLEWSAELENITPIQIKDGIDRFMDNDDEFINLKKFKRLCLHKPVTEHDINHAAYKVYSKDRRLKDMTGNERSQKVKDHFISKMKNSLSGYDDDGQIVDLEDRPASLPDFDGVSDEELKSIHFELVQESKWFEMARDPDGSLKKQQERNTKMLHHVKSKLMARGIVFGQSNAKV